MAGLSSFFKEKEQVKIGSATLGYIILDAAISETHKRKATITKNQIEDGSNISDHYRKENESISIEGIIGEKPISDIDSVTNVASSFAASKVGGLAGIVTQAAAGILAASVLSESENRQIDNLKKFEEFMENASIVDVVTALKTYKNMAIETVDFPKNARLGDSLRFTISLTEMRIVESKTVKLQETSAKGGTAHSAATKQDLGKQKALAPSASESGASSVLFKLFN
jgi:hypothetical protein